MLAWATADSRSAHELRARKGRWTSRSCCRSIPCVSTPGYHRGALTVTVQSARTRPRSHSRHCSGSEQTSTETSSHGICGEPVSARAVSAAMRRLRSAPGALDSRLAISSRTSGAGAFSFAPATCSSACRARPSRNSRTAGSSNRRAVVRAACRSCSNRDGSTAPSRRVPAQASIQASAGPPGRKCAHARSSANSAAEPASAMRASHSRSSAMRSVSGSARQIAVVAAWWDCRQKSSARMTCSPARPRPDFSSRASKAVKGCASSKALSSSSCARSLE
jgi:hypothetical protein